MTTPEPMHPLVRLARRFTVDWLDRADPDVPRQILAPDYRIHIGTVHMTGLADYLAATLGQLARFPGLQLTVHELVHDGRCLALHFTEHGASPRDGMRAAAWTGIALFDWDGARLTENWTQEDYSGRRRQLAEGTPDLVGRPAVAPWTTPPGDPDPAAEAVVRQWLQAAQPGSDGVRWDDGSRDVLVTAGDLHVERVFSAGDRVAFAATRTGTVLARTGTVLAPAASDATGRLGLAGLVAVTEGTVAGGTVVSDRLGVQRALRGR